MKPTNREIQEVVDGLIFMPAIGPFHRNGSKGYPGAVIEFMSKESREILKHCTSEHFNHPRMMR